MLVIIEVIVYCCVISYTLNLPYTFIDYVVKTESWLIEKIPYFTRLSSFTVERNNIGGFWEEKEGLE